MIFSSISLIISLNSSSDFPVGSSNPQSSSKGLPTKISINSSPYRTEYFVGDTINTRGLTLLAEYADGSQEIISEGYECSVSEFSKAGTQKITVKYNGKTTTFEVNVKKDKSSDNVLVKT